MANALIVGILASLVVFVVVCYPVLVTPEMWMYIACSVWILCTGGIVYVRMEDPKVYGHHFEKDKHGNDTLVIDEWFERAARSQYGYEGFIASSLVTVIGIMFVMLIVAPKCFRDAMFLRVYMLSLAGIIYFAFFQLCAIYRLKYQWWNPTFEPPPHFQKGSLLANQGFNIL